MPDGPATMTVNDHRTVMERALEAKGINPDHAEAIAAAIDHAGLKLQPRGSLKRAEILSALQAECFEVRGRPGMFLWAIGIPGRGWLVWAERQCCRGRQHSHDPPIFIAGDGGSLQT